VRRADAFFLTIRNSFFSDRFPSGLIPGASTYRAVQIRETTSYSASNSKCIEPRIPSTTRSLRSGCV
jgi:hypothetical protein